MSILSLLTNQEWFLPAKELRYFTKHKQRKVIQLCDISDKGEILEKRQMERKLDVPLRWYQYFQLTCFLKTVSAHQAFKNTLTDKEIVLKDMRISQKGFITKIYKILLAQAMQKPVLYQILWNRDRLQLAGWEDVWSSYGFKSYIFNIKFQSF